MGEGNRNNEETDLDVDPIPDLSDTQIYGYKSVSRHGSDAIRPSGTPTSGASAVELSQVVGKCVAPLLEKCESLNAKVDRTHAKLATGLRVNVTLLEKMGKDLAEMKEAVQALTGTSAVLRAQKLDQVFPLKTPAEVDRYLADDPDATLAMER